MTKLFIIHENDEWIKPLRIYLHDLQIVNQEELTAELRCEMR